MLPVARVRDCYGPQRGQVGNGFGYRRGLRRSSANRQLSGVAAEVRLAAIGTFETCPPILRMSVRRVHRKSPWSDKPMRFGISDCNLEHSRIVERSLAAPPFLRRRHDCDRRCRLGTKERLRTIQLALTHRTPSGFCNLGPAQTISRMQAVSTRNAARLLQWDDIGSLSPGFHADLIVLGRDP